MLTVTRLLSLFRVRQGARRAAALSLVLMFAALPFGSGCGVITDDNSSSYLIVNTLEAASGAVPATFGSSLGSDVITKNVFLSDGGRAKFTLGMKNPLLKPTSANFITITRYRVEFRRADGTNGFVPAAFESAFTLTVSGDATAGFTLIPVSIKQTPEMLALIDDVFAEIDTIATVTFFGTDQAGREISASGVISVTFADWVDPQ